MNDRRKLKYDSGVFLLIFTLRYGNFTFATLIHFFKEVKWKGVTEKR